MLRMREGCRVPFPEMLSEGYMYDRPRFVANVHADKIAEVVTHFITMHDEPQFFILELPSKLQHQKILRPGVVENFQKDVYYIDGCSPNETCDLFAQIAPLLIRDGLCDFGFGCHESRDEIMVGKYNVVTVWCQDPDRYENFFEQHGIPFVSRLTTAWNTFSRKHGGDSWRVETNGKTVFDLPQMLADWGIYLAEQRDEP